MYSNFMDKGGLSLLRNLNVAFSSNYLNRPLKYLAFYKKLLKILYIYFGNFFLYPDFEVKRAWAIFVKPVTVLLEIINVFPDIK